MASEFGKIFLSDERFVRKLVGNYYMRELARYAPRSRYGNGVARNELFSWRRVRCVFEMVVP